MITGKSSSSGIPSIFTYDMGNSANLLGDLLNAVSDTVPKIESVLHLEYNVLESDSDYKIFIDLPGVDKEAVVVEVIDDKLAIKGEKIPPKAKENTKLANCSRSFGKFDLEITMSKDLNKDNISAIMDNGVLTVTVAKKIKVPVSIKVK